MLRLLILADDLSGAADCAVACVDACSTAVVALQDISGDIQSEVLSVDADTRGMTPESAAAEMDRLVRKYAHRTDVLLFKKIDSTLRGNIGIELVAALDAYRSLHASLRPAVAIMAPAFPAIGRTTVNGLQHVHGRPLHETEIWRLHGMSGRSHIPDVLNGSGLKSGLLPLEMIRSGALAEAMRTFANDVDVLVCDAETDEDLRAIAEASMELGRKAIWVGSAGLAHHLPHAANLGTQAVSKATLPPLSGPVLFVIASLSRNSIEQVKVLTSSSQTLRLTIPPDVLLAGAESPRWQEYERELVRAIDANRDVVISPGSDPHVEIFQRPLLSAALAQMTAAISGKIGGLVAGGGETARMVLRSWGVTGLRLIGELEKGIPISVMENWSRQLPVVTKAGDFGNPQTLLKCSQFLHNNQVNGVGKL